MSSKTSKKEVKTEIKKEVKKEVKKEKEKEIEIETETETEAEVSDSNEEMETHSIWYGRLKTNPIEAKFFKEFLNDFKVVFKLEDSEYESVLNHYWGKSLEELEKLIKTQNKREKKAKENFKADGLTKPKSGYNLYCKYYATDCKSKEIKFELKNASSSWNELSDSKKQTYINDALKQKSDYIAKYESLKSDAIKNGEISAEKPKGPVTAYFRYLNENRPKIKEKLIKQGETEKLNTKITSEAGKMWKQISDTEKEPYETIYHEEKENYKVKLEKWKVIETARLKIISGESEDIKIDESCGTEIDDKKTSQDSEIIKEIVTEENTTKKTSKKEPKVKKEKKSKVNDTDEDD